MLRLVDVMGWDGFANILCFLQLVDEMEWDGFANMPCFHRVLTTHDALSDR